MKKRFNIIDSGFRIAEKKENDGWKLVRQGSGVAIFTSRKQAKNYVKNRPYEEFILINPDGSKNG